MATDTVDFEIESLPDGILLARCKISATDLPARARRRAMIDLTGVYYYDAPLVPVNFAVILRVFMESVAGLQVQELCDRDNEDADARKSRHHRIALEFYNATDDLLSFEDKLITMYGFGRAVREEGATNGALSALVAQALEFVVETEADVALTARFEDMEP